VDPNDPAKVVVSLDPGSGVLYFGGAPSLDDILGRISRLEKKIGTER
jgi:hypothetical protein